MLHVFKVELVPTRVEHVNHLVRKDTLNHSDGFGYVLTHDDLIELGIVAPADLDIANLARYVPPQIDFAEKSRKGIEILQSFDSI